MKFWQGYLASLISPQVMSTAFRVALVVGSLLFAINHGKALLDGHMNVDRWLSAGVTYLVPYLVNAHGQYIAKLEPGDTP
jgi:hypothetical protein